jgi:hypothetical protein
MNTFIRPGDRYIAKSTLEKKCGEAPRILNLSFKSPQLSLSLLDWKPLHANV